MMISWTIFMAKISKIEHHTEVKPNIISFSYNSSFSSVTKLVVLSEAPASIINVI